MRWARGGVVTACLLAAFAVAYWGARAALDAAGVGSSQQSSRPGIHGIAAGPAPEVPASAPAEPKGGDADTGSGEAADSPTETVATDMSGEVTQDAASEYQTGEDEGEPSGGEATEEPTPSSSQPGPEPPAEEPKEDPPVIRYPGK